jgi:hypothetical protein
MALSLNAADMTQPVSSLGYGSYVYADGMICFTSLYPSNDQNLWMTPVRVA